MTVLTLGSWLVMWILWGLFRERETIHIASLSAHPGDDGTIVEIESNNEQWSEDMEAWLRRTYEAA
jgi:hypothetical protein